MVRKQVKFAELMRAVQRLRPASLDFLPRTVIVPVDPDKDILEVLSKGYGILKPDEGTQGDGIYLVNHLDEIKRRMACIHVESAVTPHRSHPANPPAETPRNLTPLPARCKCMSPVVAAHQ